MTTVINQSMMFGSGSSVAMNGSTFQVGLQGGALKSVGSGLPAGVSVSGQAIAIKQAGAVLDGYDLRGYSVTVQANGVTIKNSLLNATGYHTITQTAGASGLVVEFNTFDGQKANGTINGDMVMSETVATIRNNEFFNLPADGVNTAGGLIEHNYFSGASYQSGAHADAISIHRTVAPVTIRGNYIDSIKSADAAQGTNAAIKIVSHFGAINDVTVDGNVLIGGGYNAYVGQDKGAITNVRLTNNLMGLTEYGDREGQYLFPGNHGANFSMSGNSLFSAAPGNLAFLGQPAAPPAPQPPVAAPTPPAPKPEAAPVASTPTASTPAPTSGSSEVTLRVSGDHYKGAPHFNVAVDGKTVATNLSTTAVHNNGEWVDVKVWGDFSKSPKTVSVTFTDDQWGGTNSTDKNLYVDYIAVNGKRYEGESVSPNKADPHAAALWSNGALTFAIDGSGPPAPVITSPVASSSEITLRVSGDQYQGTPHFNVSVDGKIVATNLTTTAVHAKDEWIDLTIKGDFSDGPHKVGITFTDDAWGGTKSTDKNLYVDYISVNGKRYEGEAVSPNKDHSNAAAALWSNGTLTFATDGAAASAQASGAAEFVI
jgi:Ca-dependent carbohydrate-binding module xylan-binding